MFFPSFALFFEDNFIAVRSCGGYSYFYGFKNTSIWYVCFEKKFGTLLNSVPLYVADKDFSGIDFITLWFTEEKNEDCKKIYNMFKEKSSADFDKTNGLYFRELL